MMVASNGIVTTTHTTAHGNAAMRTTLLPYDEVSPRQRLSAVAAILAAGVLRSLAHWMTVLCRPLLPTEPFAGAGRQPFVWGCGHA